MAQADQHAPERQAGNEGAGAVDGVEDPDEFGVGPVLAIFLADHSMLGKALGDQFANRRLGAAICGRDRIEGVEPRRAAFVFQAMVGAEQGKRHLGGGLVQLEDQVFEGGQAIRAEHA